MKRKLITMIIICSLLVSFSINVFSNNEIENIMEKTRKLLGIAPEEYEVIKMDKMLGKCDNNKISN